jgi:hypothetical protein
MVRLPQNYQCQPSPEAVNSHYGDVADKECNECAQCQEMQAPCALPPAKDLDIPRETSGDGRGHRYSRRNAERREQEYHRRVA